MTETQLKDMIYAQLGGQTVCLELTPDSWTQIFFAATQWFNARVALTKRMPLQIAPSTQSEYTLPEEVIDVNQVYFPGLDFMTSFSFDMPFHILWQLPHGWARSGMRFSGLVERLQYLETAQRILGGPAWDYDPATRKLTLATSMNTQDVSLIIYEYTALATDIASIQKPYDIQLYSEYALAQAKIQLGRARSKFDSLPSAQGSVTLDGITLLNEANEKIKELEEKTLSRSDYSPIVMG